ncbi:MAG: prepilin-type N-terminal cleavage/methylation domain-containing protein [Candidatus Parcubacteria bacterium]|nr:prepilin-type N-terminal cleavage/methylation domain-containing protein [Candidatus Parcubacteria bacterium]
MNKGFTIIEMVVAVGVFAVVMTVSLAAFLNVSDIQKRAEALRVINDNLNFSLETMMREIRAGSNYRVGSGGTSLTIAGVSGGDITYRSNNGRIEKSVAGNPITLTAPEVNIIKLLFIREPQTGPQYQPRITIIINGSAGEKKVINLNLQTTISQRKLGS